MYSNNTSKKTVSTPTCFLFQKTVKIVFFVSSSSMLNVNYLWSAPFFVINDRSGTYRTLEDMVTEDQYTDFCNKHLGGGNFGRRSSQYFTLGTQSIFSFIPVVWTKICFVWICYYLYIYKQDCITLSRRILASTSPYLVINSLPKLLVQGLIVLTFILKIILISTHHKSKFWIGMRFVWIRVWIRIQHFNAKQIIISFSIWCWSGFLKLRKGKRLCLMVEK